MSRTEKGGMIGEGGKAEARRKKRHYLLMWKDWRRDFSKWAKRKAELSQPHRPEAAAALPAYSEVPEVFGPCT
jgi:hypothetical protein